MMHSLDKRTFNEIRRIIYDSTGIQITENKTSLVISRLWRRVNDLHLSSFEDYVHYLQKSGCAAEHQHLVDLLSTNETYFFREPAHFERLRTEILPHICHRPIRIWSAACASGEEAYSIAMVLADRLGLNGWQVLGTDVSQRVLETGRHGLYNHARLEYMPQAYLTRFCKRGLDEFHGKLRINADLRRNVTFAHHNLLHRRVHSDRFDVIFLRNVLIYFDQATKQQVLNHLIESLRPDGWLIIGHCDSLHGLTVPMRMITPSVYQREQRSKLGNLA